MFLALSDWFTNTRINSVCRWPPSQNDVDFARKFVGHLLSVKLEQRQYLGATAHLPLPSANKLY